MLNNWRFLNTVILENIPAFIIQQIYISRNQNETLSAIVWTTILFTIVSLIFSFLTQMSRCCQIFRLRHDKFISKEVITCKLIIENKRLEDYHACTERLIETSIVKSLESSDDLEDLHYRLDTSFEIEVYDLKSEISNKNKSITAKFDCVILSDEYDSLDEKNVSGHKSSQTSMI